MTVKDKIEIIIISYNSCEMTLDCIESVYKTTAGLDIGITIVDNASEDDTIPSIEKKFPNIKIIRNENNIGYAAAVNKGVRTTDAEFLIVSNNDVLYHELAINRLITYLKNNSDTAVAGPQQIYPDGSWEYSYGNLPGIILGVKNLFLFTSLHQNWQRKKWKKRNTGMMPKTVGYIDGAVMAINKDVFELLNGFDEDYFFYTEEADFCKRTKDLSYNVKFIPDSLVTHFRGGSSARMGEDENKAEAFIKSKFIYCNKHLSPISTRIYASLEIVHNYSMILIWKLINLFFRKKKKQFIRTKVSVYRILAKAWENNYSLYKQKKLITGNK